MKKWELINRETIFESKYLSAYKSKYKLPSGKEIDDWYTFKRGNFVLILAQNSKGEILLEKNYRPAADNFFYELPAGWIEDDEEIIDSALRELKEETGFDGKGSLYGPFYVLPGASDVCSYVAVIDITNDIPDMVHRDEDEMQMELLFVGKNKLNKMIVEGEIKDEGLMVGLSVLNSLKDQK